MSFAAVALVCASAFIHAGWNVAGKRRHPSAAFFLAASLSGAALLSPALVMDGVPARVWLLLVVTGAFMAMYYIALAGAYRAGDMSLAYPLARSSPAVLVTVVAAVLGRGHEITTQCLVGIGAVAIGCFLLPMRRFTEVRLSNYLNPTCALALLAAVGTAGYSVIDDEALRTLREALSGVAGTTRATLYACLESLTAAVWLTLFIAGSRVERTRLRGVLRVDLGHAVPAGFAISIAYALALIALAYARNVSYVVALRQLSVVLGAVFAIVILKEPPYRPKLVGVALAFAGLALVATG